MRMRPRPFSGTDALEDVEGWLLHFEGICVANGVTEDAKKIALLMVSTTEEATRWVRAHARWLMRPGRVWTEVKNALIVRF